MAEETPAVASAEPAAAPVTPVPTAVGTPDATVTIAVPGVSETAPAVVAPVVTPPAQEAPVIPEKYEFVTPKDAVLDETVTAEFAGLAKELKISQADAQKMIDKMAPLLAKNEVSRDAARVQAAVEKASTEWGNQAKIDKEFGGDNFEANLAVAKQAFTNFGTPALEAMLKASGLDSHPEMIRWAYRVGKQLSPDNKVVSGNTNAQQVSGSFEERAAAKLYSKS